MPGSKPVGANSDGAPAGALRRAALAIVTGLCLVVGCVQAQAGEIYKWVDDQGATHLSDTVPQAYKARAKVVGGTDDASVDPADQAAARARDAKDAERLRRMQNAKPPPVSPSAPAAAKAAPAPAAVSGGSDCASLMAAYRASQACYAPYVTKNGLRGGSDCTPVPDPSPQCGSTSTDAN